MGLLKCSMGILILGVRWDFQHALLPVFFAGYVLSGTVAVVPRREARDQEAPTSNRHGETLCVSVGGRCYDVNGVWSAWGRENRDASRRSNQSSRVIRLRGDDRTGPGERHNATLGGEGEGEEGKSKTEEARRVGRVCLGSCCRGVARQEEKGMETRGRRGRG